MESLAIVIVNYRTADLTIACVRALEAARAAFSTFRVIVVEGGSGDGSAEVIGAAIADLDWASLLPLEINGGFAFANNQAIAQLARSGPLPDAIALINPDARVLPGALEALAAVLDRQPRAAAVGALLVHEDGRPQASAFPFPSLRGEFCRGARTGALERLLRVPPAKIDADGSMEVPWVTGAAVMLRTAALHHTGLFDEGFFLYFEETDLMRRLRRHGWSIWHEPAAMVVHAGGAATNIRDPLLGTPRRQRTPAYWYAARKRYFALAHGRPVALVASMLWLLGNVWWQARQILVPQRDDGPLRIIGDLLEFGLWPSRFDAAPACPALAAPASLRPAWMDRAR